MAPRQIGPYWPGANKYFTRSKRKNGANVPIPEDVTPVQVPTPPSRMQRSRQATAKRISNDWPINRINKASRGLYNNRVACYRNSSLQQLLHLPKFLNWILEHNNGAAPDWPCNTSVDAQGRPKDDNRVDRHGEDDLIPASAHHCIACIMKDLVRDYWSDVKQKSPRGREPPVIMHEIPGTPPRSTSMTPFHAMAERWSLPRKTPGVPETQERRFQREIEQGMQQAADEFQLQVLSGIEDSIDQDTNVHRHRQYLSLFHLTKREIRTCIVCEKSFKQPWTTSTHTGLDNVQLRRRGRPDTIEAAIRRTMTGTTPSSCRGRCRTVQEHEVNFSIDGAPEYLRVKLSLDMQLYGGADETAKNTNPVKLGTVLDLTEHASEGTTPIRYRLIGVVTHSGPEITSGHYISLVSGPESKYEVNDSFVTRLGAADDDHVLTANPYRNHETRFNAMILMYVRIPNEPVSRLVSNVAEMLEASQFRPWNSRHEVEEEAEDEEMDDGEEDEEMYDDEEDEEMYDDEDEEVYDDEEEAEDEEEHDGEDFEDGVYDDEEVEDEEDADEEAEDEEAEHEEAEHEDDNEDVGDGGLADDERSEEEVEEYQSEPSEKADSATSWDSLIE